MIKVNLTEKKQIYDRSNSILLEVHIKNIKSIQK